VTRNTSSVAPPTMGVGCNIDFGAAVGYFDFGSPCDHKNLLDLGSVDGNVDAND